MNMKLFRRLFIRRNTNKVWTVSCFPGDPEETGIGLSTDASGPYPRGKALEQAQMVLAHYPRWRLWVHHERTGERIFESDSEKAFRAKWGAGGPIVDSEDR